MEIVRLKRKVILSSVYRKRLNARLENVLGLSKGKRVDANRLLEMPH